MNLLQVIHANKFLRGGGEGGLDKTFLATNGDRYTLSMAAASQKPRLY